jgi:hypothetical protein
MEGLLQKRSEWVKRWDARYFVLSASERKLYYFAKKGAAKAKGSFALAETGSVDTDATQPGAFALVPARGAKRVLLAANSVEARNKWMRAIQSAQAGVAPSGGSSGGSSSSSSSGGGSGVGGGAAPSGVVLRTAPAALAPPSAPALPPPDASDPLSWMVDAAEEAEESAAAAAEKEKVEAAERRAAKAEREKAAHVKREAAKAAAATIDATSAAAAGASPGWLVDAGAGKATYAATDSGIRDAVKAGDLAGVTLLLSTDPALALRSDASGSALHLAAMFNRTDIALLLVSAGSDPTMPNRSRETAMDLAGVVLGKKMAAAWTAR